MISAGGADVVQFLRRCAYRTQHIVTINAEVTEAFHRIDAEADVIEDAIASPDWPLAVDPAAIVSTDAEKDIRARNVLSVFLPDGVNGLRILDYGCGEGHLVRAAQAAGADATGYDPHATGDLSEFGRLSGPYDVVFLYDVLDHADSPANLLRHVYSLCRPGSRLFVRCHPWCSRHGGHLFKNINKAYLHLFLSAEVGRLLSHDYPAQRVIHPLGTYSAWFADAGLSVVAEEPVVTPVEPFFHALAHAVKKNWKTSPLAEFASGDVFPEFPMSVEFVDYELTPKG